MRTHIHTHIHECTKIKNDTHKEINTLPKGLSHAYTYSHARIYA